MPRARLALLFPLGLLAGCATTVTPPRSPTLPIAAAPPPPAASGLDRVMGRDATTLIALLGQPALDAREGPARRLQFRGPACVLDAYLYPLANTPGPLRVTWIDARAPAGGEFDRASCIAALVRR